MGDRDYLESKIDDLKHKADSFESDARDLIFNVNDAKYEIDEAKYEIQKLNEDLNIWGLFNAKMIPYVYDKTLYKLLEKLEKNKYKEAVDCFKTCSSDIAYPLDINNYNKKKRILQCTIFLKNSKEFFKFGKIASSDTAPIFYYYSISYLFSFLLYSLVYFNKPKPHHGIYVNTDNGISSIRYNYNIRGGFFERVVHILSMLDYPSSFSSFISSIDNDDQRILVPQNTDISISNEKSLLLDKLLEYDSCTDYNKLGHDITYRIPELRYEKTSAILRDFILIFVASAIARYKPALWRDIYSGENSKLIFHFEKSFNNINNMIRLVNDIITQAEKGTLLKNEKEINLLDMFL